MERLFIPFEPQPAADERPARLNSPFDADGPPPLARRAAEAVMAGLSTGLIAPGFPTALLHGADGGKMFGVLVAQAPDGTVGYLKAVSAQLARSWEVPGFVPPVFDKAARDRAEPRGEAVVKALTARVEAREGEAALREVTEALAALQARQQEEARGLAAHHAGRRAERHRLRAQLTSGEADATDALQVLAKQSQGDDMDLRRARAAQRDERAPLEARLKRLLRRQAALERLRRFVSRAVVWQLYDTYQFQNARGQHVSLRALWAPKVPSSGTGDCAAPKLLVYAQRQGLKPLAIAEFWWGGPPPGGGRQQGQFFPACRDKCGPLLPFLLEGVEVAPSRRFRPGDLSRHPLPVVYEDARLVVVNKPAGLLSVPGTDAAVTDSVLARLKARYPNATGPLLAHRLDLETSGLLVAALDEAAYVALQKQFIARTVEKRYVAVLAGLLAQETGVIELPLRVDLAQRPRQVVDFEHGKAATTRFSVVERARGRTRVHFFPQSGRTHQLRVHASHALGLGLPIVGDLLYGEADTRLLLHAERLAVTHPESGARLAWEVPAEF